MASTVTFTWTFILSLLITLHSVLGFSFSVDQEQPAQCGTVKFSWSGGSPPFRLLILPALDYPSNISLPDTAWSGSTGSYSWTVNYPGGTRFVALMSDAHGIATGGVSNLLTVQSSSDNGCALRSTDTDFLFYLNETTVSQCQPLQVYWDATATAPVTILGAIPGGQPFQLWSANIDTSLSWNTNIAAKTQFILAAFDSGSKGNGGSSGLLTVGESGSSACIDDSSPSSTPAGSPTASETGSATGGVKTVTAITTATGGAGLSTGSIVGIVVAAVAVVFALQGVLFYFCCRRQFAALLSHRRQMREHEVKAGDVDLLDDPQNETGAQATSLQPVSTESTSNRPSFAGGRSRHRSSVADAFEIGSAVSPYWDPAPASPTAYHGGPFEDPLLPPPRAHERNDSLSSTQSRPVTFISDTSPSLSSINALNPFSSPGSALVPLPNGQTRAPPPQGFQTKAQMAAAMFSANPDREQGPSQFGARLPRQEPPPGGIRLHEDAGRVDGDAAALDVEELPPMYRPEWETESERGRSSGGPPSPGREAPASGGQAPPPHSYHRTSSIDEVVE